MSIEEAIMGGIVFKGKKDKPQEDEKVKTKAKKATYIRGQHGSGAAKMKADIRKKRANRHKKLLLSAKTQKGINIPPEAL